MKLPPGLQRMGSIGTIAIVALLSAHPLGYVFREILMKPKASLATTSLSVASETSGQEIKICHHHPQGCPKECFCPKMTMASGNPDDSALEGTLSTPVFSQCTEDVFQADFNGGILLFSGAPWQFQLFETTTLLNSAAIYALVDRHPDPSQKIPIA